MIMLVVGGILAVCAAVAWVLRPDVVPSWASAALDAAIAQECGRAAHILHEVNLAGAGGVANVARQVAEQGPCLDITPEALSDENAQNSLAWVVSDGPIFDPELDALDSETALEPDWWRAQLLYIRCWRRFGPDRSVDLVRVERAINHGREGGSKRLATQQAACGQAYFSKAVTFLESDEFMSMHGNIPYRHLVQAQHMGYVPAMFVRGKMLVEKDWRFKRVERDDFEGYATLFEAAKAGYPPAERMLALALADRKEVRLPDDLTYFWLVRAWTNWEAYDWRLDSRLKQFSSRLKQPYPPKDLSAEDIKRKSESRPPEPR